MPTTEFSDRLGVPMPVAHTMEDDSRLIPGRGEERPDNFVSHRPCCPRTIGEPLSEGCCDCQQGKLTAVPPFCQTPAPGSKLARAAVAELAPYLDAEDP